MTDEQEIYKMAQEIACFTVSDKSVSSRKLAAHLYGLGYTRQPSQDKVEAMRQKYIKVLGGLVCEVLKGADTSRSIDLNPYIDKLILLSSELTLISDGEIAIHCLELESKEYGITDIFRKGATAQLKHDREVKE